MSAIIHRPRHFTVYGDAEALPDKLFDSMWGTTPNQMPREAVRPPGAIFEAERTPNEHPRKEDEGPGRISVGVLLAGDVLVDRYGIAVEPSDAQF